MRIPNPGEPRNEFFNREFYIQQTKKQPKTPPRKTVGRTTVIGKLEDDLEASSYDEDGHLDMKFGKLKEWVWKGNKLVEGEQMYLVGNPSEEEILKDTLIKADIYCSRFIITMVLCE
jgi:hypothetical protein